MQCTPARGSHQISDVSQIAGDGEVPRLCARPLSANAATGSEILMSRVSAASWGFLCMRARTLRQFDLDAQQPWQRCGGCVGLARRSVQHLNHQSSVIRYAQAGCASEHQRLLDNSQSRRCTSAAPPPFVRSLILLPLLLRSRRLDQPICRLPTFPPLVLTPTRHSSLPPH